MFSSLTSSVNPRDFVMILRRQGGSYLAGDAARIHSPFGGQGMNQGVQAQAIGYTHTPHTRLT